MRNDAKMEMQEWWSLLTKPQLKKRATSDDNAHYEMDHNDKMTTTTIDTMMMMMMMMHTEHLWNKLIAQVTTMHKQGHINMAMIIGYAVVDKT